MDDGGYQRLGVGDGGLPVKGRIAERLAGGDVMKVLFPAVYGTLEDPYGSRLDEVEPPRGLALEIDQFAFRVVATDQLVANPREDGRRQAPKIRVPPQDGQRVVHALLRGVPSLAYFRRRSKGFVAPPLMGRMSLRVKSRRRGGEQDASIRRFNARSHGFPRVDPLH